LRPSADTSAGRESHHILVQILEDVAAGSCAGPWELDARLIARDARCMRIEYVQRGLALTAIF